MENEQAKKVLAFGTFDGLHLGHVFFLNEATKLGILHVSVASDESVLQRKGRVPMQSSKQRREAVEDLHIAVGVTIGDAELNKWTDLKEIKPDIIAVGFDQFGLKTALQDIQHQYKFVIEKINQKNDAIS
ncbi:MAG TPA: adenylyltransferase/cytidyltransferase family protein [Candidatus Paceibacterota bacterium]